jgi:hypothetical protein
MKRFIKAWVEYLFEKRRAKLTEVAALDHLIEKLQTILEDGQELAETYLKMKKDGKE